MKASVIIPTLNGGKLLLKVCKALVQQDFNKAWEVIIIDSQSTDDSIQIATELFKKTQINLKLVTIPKENFQHGKTRNQAIENSSGEIILLLTQDAIPAQNDWLSTMVRAFDHKIIGGAFGRHIAHENHPKLIQRDLENHFNQMNKYPIRKIADQIQHGNELSLRQVFHYFSNNNSAISRKMWKKIPFPEVDFGEDQTWAKKVIENGNAISYNHNSIVFHSHDFSLIQSCVRNRTEKNFFLNNFGYNLKIDRRRILPILFSSIKKDFFWLLKTNQLNSKEIIYSLKKNISAVSF